MEPMIVAVGCKDLVCQNRDRERVGKTKEKILACWPHEMDMNMDMKRHSQQKPKEKVSTRDRRGIVI